MKKSYICPQIVVHRLEMVKMLAASDIGLVINDIDEADESESLVKGNGLYDNSSFDFEW